MCVAYAAEGAHQRAAADTRIVRRTVAKKKSLFNDRPVEISELTYILKRDMANLNAQIAQLQQLKPSGSGGSGKGGRADEHNANVVVMLQGRLANASMGFKDVLETRTNNMKAARERGQVFGDAAPMSSSNNGAAFAGPSGVLLTRETLCACLCCSELTLTRAAVPQISCCRFTSLQHRQQQRPGPPRRVSV